jgi:hypothetical protein
MKDALTNRIRIWLKKLFGSATDFQHFYSIIVQCHRPKIIILYRWDQIIEWIFKVHKDVVSGKNLKMPEMAGAAKKKKMSKIFQILCRIVSVLPCHLSMSSCKNVHILNT